MEVSNPVVPFAEELNIDLRLGSDSGNLVTPNSRRGKKVTGTPVWPDNQPVSQIRPHLLNLQKRWPVLPYPV